MLLPICQLKQAKTCIGQYDCNDYCVLFTGSRVLDTI